MVIYRDSDIHSSQDDLGFDQMMAPSSTNLLARSLHKGGLSHNHSSSAPYNHNDIMCAMEELSYNRKLTGALPFGRSQANRTRSPDDDDDSNDDDDDDGSANQPSEIPQVLWNKKRSLSKRDAPISQGCPNSRKSKGDDDDEESRLLFIYLLTFVCVYVVAFMGAAADCSYVKSYGGIRLARIQMITDWNVASAVYERTFNVSLGLIYMQMSTSQCPEQPSQLMNWNQDCSSQYTINNRLSDFSFWRGQRGSDQAALWHLMTKCSTGVKVGIAWLSQLCEYQASQQIEGKSHQDPGGGRKRLTGCVFFR
jgi:hypothetical protein